MQIKPLRPPRSRYLERGAAELSREAVKRWQWFDHDVAHARNSALTCRYFGISRETFYRWKRRYDRQDLRTLESRSHRPYRRRRPTWTAEQAERVGRLREQYPRWGKDKLAVLLRDQGWKVSVSMVGRILSSLRQRGALRAPLLFRVKRRRGTAGRPWALRKPSDDAVARPGDLVQLDTMDLRPAPGVVLKPFTARDVVSRWDVIEVHRRATSTAAASLPPSSKPRAASGACACSCCRPARPNSTDTSSAPTVPLRRNSMRSPPARSLSPSLA